MSSIAAQKGHSSKFHNLPLMLQSPRSGLAPSIFVKYTLVSKKYALVTKTKSNFIFGNISCFNGVWLCKGYANQRDVLYRSCQKVVTKQGNTSNLLHNVEKHHKVLHKDSQALNKIGRPETPSLCQAQARMDC